MKTSFEQHLSAMVDEHVARWPGVLKKRMFGCDAFFVGGHIFALIWVSGRIGVRLPEAAAFDEANSLSGSEPWMPGPKMKKGFAHWVLLPESVHDDDEMLGDWLKRAHKMNQTSEKKPVPPTRKKPAAKPKKKPARRK